ncbi:MAG: hypothetical protein R2761_07375 [Acidimicrobiales bacterium]
MSEASYTAWDDNLYAWPPPEGWYQATDGRWWPAGYGPAEHAPPAAASTGDPAVPEAGGLDPYDQRTSAIPAGGLAAAAASGPVERAEAENRRRVFDELPPIDDVFGGIDPYADDEEAIAPPPAAEAREQVEPPPADTSERVEPPAAEARERVEPPPAEAREWVEPAPAETSERVEPPPAEARERVEPPPAEPPGRPVGSDGPGAAPPDSPDRGYLLLSLADEEPRPAAAGGPVAVPPPPSSLLGGPGGANGSAREPEPAPFDAAATVFAPSPSPSPPPADPGVAGGDPTGPMAGRPTAAPEAHPGPPPTADGPGRPPVEEWAAATTILPRDDDGATTQLDLEALLASERDAFAAGVSPGARGGDRAGGWEGETDWGDDDRGRERAPGDRDPLPSGGGAAFHRELGEPGDDPSGRAGGYGGYGDVPLGPTPAPRRWWPLVAIGLAVVVAAASIGGYFLLRDDTQSASADGADPAGEGPPGSFASPYPFGKVVVVYYNDEETQEQRRWVIQVLAPVVDATQQLVDAGTASAPGQGEVLALARVRITYQSGPEPGSLSDLRFKAVGAAPGTVFDGGASCPAASPLDEAAQVEVLDSAEGDLCWRIPQGELATLKLAVEAEAADGTVHMELSPPAGG